MWLIGMALHHRTVTKNKHIRSRKGIMVSTGAPSFRASPSEVANRLTIPSMAFQIIYDLSLLAHKENNKLKKTAGADGTEGQLNSSYI